MIFRSKISKKINVFFYLAVPHFGNILVHFRSIFGSSWAPFWELFGSLLAPSGHPASVSAFCRQLVGILGRLGCQFWFILEVFLDQKFIQKSFKFSSIFGCDFGSILHPKLVPRLMQTSIKKPVMF